MKIVQAGDNFDVDETASRRLLDAVLSRPLFAHLATASEHGPRESPVWFLWEEEALWIIGNYRTDTFPRRVEREPRCAVGIVDFDLATGFVQHVGFLLTSRGEPFFLDAYSAVAPSFDPHAPTPTTFLSYLTTLPGFPYVVPLAGGAGELVIADVGATPRTASLVAVPEPSSLILAGLGGLALFVGRTS